MAPDEEVPARPENARLTVTARRRALRLGYVYGVLWSVGNGLTSGTLTYFLAQELGARGLALSLLIAAPSLIGLLRLATPALIGPLGGVKATCLKASLASYVLLTVGLPLVILGGDRAKPITLAALIALICAHQLLEYVGLVALWSWFGSLVPLRVRGRYFAWRNIWQLPFLICALWFSGEFIDKSKQQYAGEPEQILTAYLIVAAIGCAFLLLSLAPLWLMPDVPSGRRRANNLRRAALAAFAPWFDPRFRRLLFYRGWLSFGNGITQAAQNVLLFRVLPLSWAQQLLIGMRLGQLALSRPVGVYSDRYGNRPVLELSQWLVAAALLFFALATPEAWWWIIGGHVCWVAYVGFNICLSNLMLKLAPAKENSGYIALFEALGGLTFGLSTIAGGALFDWMQAHEISLPLGPFRLDYFAILFVAGAILRAMGVFWLARIREPGAWAWREIMYRLARGRERLN